MKVHLINPSALAFGVGVITPRWLYVLAAATPEQYGDPIITDETLEPWDPDDRLGRRRRRHRHPYRQRGATATRSARSPARAAPTSSTAAFTPRCTRKRRRRSARRTPSSRATAIWCGRSVIEDCVSGAPLPMYDGGKVEGGDFKPARWSLIPPGKYMWASVQTVRGCPKHCSFCSVWKTDGQRPRQRTSTR